MSWFLGVALALGIAVSAQAQQGTAQTINGQIVAKDDSASTFTVQTQDGQRITFRAQDQTTFSAQGQAADLNDLRVGDQVTVRAQAPAAGSETGTPSDRVATSVEVRSRAGAAPSSSPPVPAARDLNGDGRVDARDTDADGDGVADVQGNADARRLPDTAGEFPLFALLGGVALGWGLVLRDRRLRQQ